MKMKKLLVGLSAFTMLAGCSSKTTSNNSSSTNLVKVDMSVNNPPTKLLGASTTTEELDWLSKAILEKGMDFMKSGISSLATYAFKTACMEMGIDVRDATTKKIDQIIQQLNEMAAQIQKGFEDITKKAQQIQDNDCMKGVLAKLNDVRSPIVGEMKTLEDIAIKEENPDYDKDFLAGEKERFILGFKEKLNFYTLSNQLWHTAELLAENLVRPNATKPSQTLMDLYDNTLGVNEVWDYQGYAPRMRFVQECTFLVNSLALLAKIDIAYKISLLPEGDSNIEGYKQNIKDMCAAVNEFNGMFQKELEKLEAIKERHDDNEKPTMSHLKRSFDSEGFVHITTDFTVSAYLATITLDDVVWTNTVDDFYNDSYSHCFKSFSSNETFYQMIYSDYDFYVNNYQVEDGYNFKYYLRDLGFRVPESRQNDFDEAIGIYKDIECRTKDRGIFRGNDYYEAYRYYDLNGKLCSNDFCRVGETFWHNFDDVDVNNDNISKKMIAFVNEDNEHLLGDVRWTIGHRNGDSSSKLIDHFYKGKNSNDTFYANYKVN